MTLPALPKAEPRRRFRIFGVILTVLATLGTIGSTAVFGFGLYAVYADETGLGAIWLFIGAAYVLFFVPALLVSTVGTRRDEFETLVVGLVLLVSAALGAPMLLLFGVFSWL